MSRNKYTFHSSECGSWFMSIARSLKKITFLSVSCLSVCLSVFLYLSVSLCMCVFTHIACTCIHDSTAVHTLQYRGHRVSPSTLFGTGSLSQLGVPDNRPVSKDSLSASHLPVCRKHAWYFVSACLAFYGFWESELRPPQLHN